MHSKLDGANRIEDIVAKAKADGQPAIAITDHGTASGLIEFYKECKKQGIKPILGVEFYTCDDINLHESRKLNHLIALAKNQTGYKNLLKLTSAANLEGFYYKPRVDDELLKKYSEGLIVCSACRGGVIPSLILENKMNEAIEASLKYQGMFEHFYLELQYDLTPEQEVVNEGLIYISKHTGIPLVATIDSHYTNKEDADYHDFLLAMQVKKRYDDPDRWRFPTKEYWFKTEAEILSHNPPPEAMANTIRIADMCDVKIEFGQDLLPRFKPPNGSSDTDYLYNLCYDELYKQIAEDKIDDPIAYLERLEFELDIINPKGLASYFLIVSDLLNYARSQNIMVGPGRGCFVPGSTILLHAGYRKNIEDVLIGDKVITHLGNIRRVTNVLRYEVNEEMYRVETVNGRKIECTNNHKVYALRSFKEKNCRNIEWIEAQKLRVGDFLTYPRGKYDYTFTEITSISKFDYAGYVYDLTVKEDTSYIVNGFAVHNSAAGSIVSYLLDITKLDPIKNGLLFERFLSLERVGLPDIDTDIDPEKREILLDYMKEKYTHICHVGATGTMVARAALKDVGSTLGIPYEIMNAITPLIPQEQGVVWSISRCLEEIPELQEYAEQYPKLFEIAQWVESRPKTDTVHAAGVVICPEDLTNHISLLRGKDNYPVSELSKDDIEELGLLKIDLLSLRNLSVIDDCLERIVANPDNDITSRIDIYNLPLDDKNVLKYLTTGDLDGVFQSSSPGMRQVYKSILPEKMTFDIITHIISLYRPGPLQFMEEFIVKTNEYEEPEYLFPELEPILSETHGILLYQEQCMRIATDLGQYTIAQSSTFRKLIAKKKSSLVAPEMHKLVYGSDKYDAELPEGKKQHIPGMLSLGIPEDKAVILADQIKSFAAYCFNKSHAASYALLVYYTAWLKYYYPVEYFASLLSFESESEEIITYITNARESNIQVMPPHINKSKRGFTIEGKKIMYGFNAVKGLGKVVVDSLIANQPFNSLEELLTRIPQKVLNKTRVAALLYSGALDDIPCEPRAWADRYTLAEAINRQKGKGVIDMEIVIDREKMLAEEKACLGVYVSGHPMDGISRPIRWSSIVRGQRFGIAGRVLKITTTKTKKDDKKMCFIELEVLEGVQKFVVFPRQYKSIKWNEGIIVSISAKRDDRGGNIVEDVTLLASSLEALRQGRNQQDNYANA